MQEQIEARVGELHDTLAELTRDHRESVAEIEGAVWALGQLRQAVAA